MTAPSPRLSVEQWRKALSEVLALGEQLAAALEADDAETAVGLANQRQVQLTGLPLTEAPVNDATVPAQLNQLSDQDRRILALANERRDYAAQSLKQLRSGKSGANAYQTIADRTR